MIVSKITLLTLFMFFVVACSSDSSYGLSPATPSNIAYYKGSYNITLDTTKNVYSMYIKYDGAVQYKLSTDADYKNISKSSVKYDSTNNLFLFPFNDGNGNMFEIMFSDKDNMKVRILDKDNKVSDTGVGKKA